MFHALSSIQYNLSNIHFTQLTKYLEGAYSPPFLYISGMSMIVLNIYFYASSKCTYFCFQSSRLGLLYKNFHERDYET